MLVEKTVCGKACLSTKTTFTHRVVNHFIFLLFSGRLGRRRGFLVACDLKNQFGYRKFFHVWQKPSIFDRVVVNISEEGIDAELSFDEGLILCPGKQHYQA